MKGFRKFYFGAIGQIIKEHKYKENPGLRYNYFRSEKGKTKNIVSYWFRGVNKITKVVYIY